MSEAWHQHLAHLSWWEEIDRFFFPGKYSCTTTWVPFDLISIVHIILLVTLVLAISLAVWGYFQSKQAKKEFKYIGDEPKNKEVY